MNRRHFLHATLVAALAASVSAAEKRAPPTMWRDIGLGEWLFDFDNESEVKAMPAAVLALAKDPAAAKAKAAKARALVEERQRATMNRLKQELPA